MKRGATPTPRHKLAAAMPYKAIRPYRVDQPPAQFIWPYVQLSMWGNDVNGDCVTAEEAFAKSCKTPGGGVFISQDEVIAWATKNGTLNGANLGQVLDLFQKSGFVQGGSTLDDGPYTAVDWTDAATLQSAIYEGPVKIGVAADQLQKTCEAIAAGVSGWFATGYQQDDNEDHCVSLCGYGTISWLAEQLGVASLPEGLDGTKPGYALFTWESVGIIDVPSLVAICGEAWLRNPTTVVQTA